MFTQLLILILHYNLNNWSSILEMQHVIILTSGLGLFSGSSLHGETFQKKLFFQRDIKNKRAEIQANGASMWARWHIANIIGKIFEWSYSSTQSCRAWMMSTFKKAV